jgi:hypothetical protein
MSSSKLPPSSEPALQNLTEAKNLLEALRQEIQQHPKLEEAIVKLELALENLTIKSGGML